MKPTLRAWGKDDFVGSGLILQQEVHFVCPPYDYLFSMIDYSVIKISFR